MRCDDSVFVQADNSEDDGETGQGYVEQYCSEGECETWRSGLQTRIGE